MSCMCLVCPMWWQTICRSLQPPPCARWHLSSCQHLPLAMSAAQWSCPGVVALRAACSLSIVTRDMEGHLFEGDITTGVFRPVVPNSFQHAVFYSVHGISHPGIRATKRLLLSRFVWKRHVRASHASGARSPSMCTLSHSTSRCLAATSAMCMWTLCRFLRGARTSSPSLTALRSGRRRCRWPQHQQLTVHVPSSVAGLHGLEFLQPSPLIGVYSSQMLCGLLFVGSSTSSMCRPPPTTRGQRHYGAVPPLPQRRSMCTLNSP